MVIEGEGRLLLDQIKSISRDVLENLMEVDDKLAKLQDYIKTKEDFNKETLLNEIKSIRLRIGVAEKEDSHEVEEEKILENMIKKLTSLIDKTLGG